MDNIELAIAAYSKWDAGEVAYISELHWISDDKSSLTLVTLVQPRLQRPGSWPAKDQPWYRVIIQFGDVRDLVLKQFGPGPRQVMGFSIESIQDRGLEGLRYYVEDYENGVIKFYAGTAALVSVESLSSEKGERAI